MRVANHDVGVRRRATCSLAARVRSIVLCLLALLVAGAPAARAATFGSGPRVALVIGNAGYPTMPLGNPLNDARAVADSLDKLGFKVIRVENATQKQMFEAVRQFGDALKGGVGLFYYAGHGVQVKGHNYLLPVDASIEREDEVAYKAFDVGLVLEKMEAAKNPMNIVILDACRNNPFARGSRSATVGLAQMDAPTGSIVAFATAPGAEAADGTGGNGLYTTYLLKYMATPGLKVEDVFKRTRVAVKQESGGRQIPWESTSLEGDFYFTAPSAGTQTVAGSAAIETELWSLVSDSNSPSAYRAYLEKYPNGRYANVARSRSAQPNAVVASVPVPVPVPASPLLPPSRPQGGFSFSAEEERMNRATPEGRDEAFRNKLAIACAPARKSARVRVDITERRMDGLGGTGARGGGFASALGQRLRQAGLRISTAGAADYVLRGSVTSQANANRELALNEVSVSAAIKLAAADGQLVSSHVSREESYAGADLLGAYSDVIEAQAIEVASQVYSDLCQR